MAKAEKPNHKKQAVVVIHGMGEQLPMGTLRSLVKTVWEKDAALQRPLKEATPVSGLMDLPGDEAAQTSSANHWWIKPDDRAGLQELRRVTTGPLTGDEHEAEWPLERGGRRTDFYEFYWADLMQGTTLQHVGSWVKGLMLRSPTLVPRDVFVIWLLLWFLVVFAGLLMLSKAVNLSLFNSFEVYCSVPTSSLALSLCKWAYVVADWIEWFWSGVMTPMLLLGAVATALWLYTGDIISGLLEGWRTRITLVFFVALGVVIWPAILALWQQGGFQLIALAAGGYLLNGVLKNYFGDVARYVQATPANVERRKAVRERGLSLLTGLHHSGQYDRIVVVSHSLGTIVAYDLINLLWSRLGPSHDNDSSEHARASLEAMDNWLSDIVDKHRNDKNATGFSPQTFRDMQRDVARDLNVDLKRDKNGVITQCPWLITDLITVGSPLAHAEFLLARDTKGLDELIRERILPVCPPVLEVRESEDGALRQSFMFKPFGSDKSYAHHASCFAAVRWTNIYDQPPNPALFMFGDAISGSVVDNLGNGIHVVNSAVRNGGLGRGEFLVPFETLKGTRLSGIHEERVNIRYGVSRLPYFFTHTEYWSWHPEYADHAKLPDHIKYLRRAIDLGEVPYVR